MSLLAKVGGFLLVPVVGGLAAKALTYTLTKVAPDFVYGASFPRPAGVSPTSSISALAQVGTALVSHKLSKKGSSTRKDFLKGGTWGAGVSAAAIPALDVYVQKHPQAYAAGPQSAVAGVLDSGRAREMLRILNGEALGSPRNKG